MAPFALLKKPSRNNVPADLLGEKNTVSAKKSWKVRIIRQANSANMKCPTEYKLLLLQVNSSKFAPKKEKVNSSKFVNT